MNPGHFHYHIHWCRSAKPSRDEQNSIRDANFDLYNLVTLFFSTEEINQFTHLITCDDQTFSNECDDAGVEAQFRYYVMGPVGVGKSTVVQQIRSIDSFDEWVDRKHELITKPHRDLSDDERTEVDTWINAQFRRKNRRLFEMRGNIAVIDRSPLDPLCFVKDASLRPKRAAELMQAMVPNPGERVIAAGHVIHLKCGLETLELRVAVRESPYTAKSSENLKLRLTNFGATTLGTSPL